MANLQLIKILAEKRGLTIRDLADSIGIKENQIHVMCRTNSTKIDTLEKIADVLGVSVAYFFEETVKTNVNIRKAGRDYVEKGKIEHKYEQTAEGGANIPSVSDCSSTTEADLRAQIAQLKSQLEDKDQIITLLKSKLK